MGATIMLGTLGLLIVVFVLLVYVFDPEVKRKPEDE